MQIEVAILPGLATRLPSRVTLVIDVVRATTSIVTLFERGARTVALAADVPSARSLGHRFPDALLLGEQAGLTAPGFAYGNSPVELSHADLRERDLVFTTSNGTTALRAVANARVVLAACLRNARAAVQVALTEARAIGADIGIICAGRERCGLVGQDDVICAGYLVELMIAENGGNIAPWQPDADFAAMLPAPPLDGGLDLDDSAWLALRLYRSVVANPALPRPDEFVAVFRQTAVGIGLDRLDLDHDTVYCAELDVCGVVPRLAEPAPDGELTMLAGGVVR
jgi:phosphosulfolactate phosphohydrolase-like enzyme